MQNYDRTRIMVFGTQVPIIGNCTTGIEPKSGASLTAPLPLVSGFCRSRFSWLGLSAEMRAGSFKRSLQRLGLGRRFCLWSSARLFLDGLCLRALRCGSSVDLRLGIIRLWSRDPQTFAPFALRGGGRGAGGCAVRDHRRGLGGSVFRFCCLLHRCRSGGRGRLRSVSQDRGGLHCGGRLFAEADLGRHGAPGFRIALRDHRIGFRQAIALPILFGGEIVRREMALQGLVRLAVDQADDVFARRQALADRHGGRERRGNGFLYGGGRIFRERGAGRLDQIGQAVASDSVVGNKGTDKLDCESGDVGLISFCHFANLWREEC